MPKGHLISILPDLPDKIKSLPVKATANYTLRVKLETRERIEIINRVKVGLADQLRDALEKIVDDHWFRIYPDSAEPGSD